MLELHRIDLMILGCINTLRNGTIKNMQFYDVIKNIKNKSCFLIIK